MRLVGAKNGYIRWPFFLEGGWIGLIGSIVPILILTYGYSQVYGLAAPYLLQSNLELLASKPNHMDFRYHDGRWWLLDWFVGFGYFNASFLKNLTNQSFFEKFRRSYFFPELVKNSIP